MAYSDFSVTTGNTVTAGNQNQNMVNIRHIVNGTNATASPADSLVSLRTSINAAGFPVGGIMPFATSSAQTGFLVCDGSSVNKVTYADLFAKIDFMYGGTGNTFDLPDYRGEFLRGFDDGAGNDPDAGSRTNRGDGTTGDNVGTKQGHQLDNHEHSVRYRFDQDGTGGTNTPFLDTGGGNSDLTTSSGGNETRPRNVNVSYQIRYQA